jgi:putative phage-type endonuclease
MSSSSTIYAGFDDSSIVLPANPLVIAEGVKAMAKTVWLGVRKSVNVTFIEDLGIWMPVCWGGSELAGILGVSPWTTRLEVWYLLRGFKLAKERVMPEESLSLGHKFEDEIAEKFAKKSGVKLVPTDRMYQSRDYPWMVADFDYLGLDPDGSLVGVEIKYTDSFNFDFKRLVREGGIPPYYEAQVRQYMAVSGLKRWYIAVGSCEGNLNGKDTINNVEYACIEWDEDIEIEIVEVSKAFINEVVKGIEPDLASLEKSSLALDAVLRVYGNAKKKLVELPSTHKANFEKIFSLEKKIEDLQKQIKEEEGRIDALSIPIIQAMKDATTGYVELEDGTRFIAENVVKETKTLDKTAVRKMDQKLYDDYLKLTGPKRLEKDHPSVYENCVKVSVSQKTEFREVKPS